MPGLDGEGLGRLVKKDPSLRDTILVMMTAVGSRGDAARMQEAGFAAFLTKPVKQSILHDCLITAMDRAVRRGTSGRAPEPILTRHTVAETRKRKVRILLAEDNATNQKVALKILEKHGYRADAVGNGREAVQAVMAMPYDLVLMDVQMPEMDGIEAARILRDRAASGVLPSRTPIIALTAHAMQGDRDKCLEAGMVGYVTKPIRPAELIEAIERNLPRGDDTRLARAPEGSSPPPAAFDRPGLLERLDGDREMYNAVLEAFLDDATRLIRTLRKAAECRDADALRLAAHSLRGASGNVGAAILEELARRVETGGEEGETRGLGPVIEEIEEQFRSLKRSVHTADPTESQDGGQRR